MASSGSSSCAGPAEGFANSALSAASNPNPFRRFTNSWIKITGEDLTRVELLPAFKFTGKMVKIKDFTGNW